LFTPMCLCHQAV